jgi:hypothetical protein
VRVTGQGRLRRDGKFRLFWLGETTSTADSGWRSSRCRSPRCWWASPLAGPSVAGFAAQLLGAVSGLFPQYA